MYNRYDIYMKQGVRDEAAYIKTGLEEDGQDFLTDKIGMPPAAASLFWEKMVMCCLTALRILLKWKTTATDQSLLKLSKKGIR